MYIPTCMHKCTYVHINYILISAQSLGITFQVVSVLATQGCAQVDNINFCGTRRGFNIHLYAKNILCSILIVRNGYYLSSIQ